MTAINRLFFSVGNVLVQIFLVSENVGHIFSFAMESKQVRR